MKATQVDFSDSEENTFYSEEEILSVGADEIFIKACKQFFKQFYKKMEAAYDYSDNKKDIEFFIKLPNGLTPEEYDTFVEALKATRNKDHFHSKDDKENADKRINIIDFTRHPSKLKIHVKMSNIDDEKRKKNFSLCKNFCDDLYKDKYGMQFSIINKIGLESVYKEISKIDPCCELLRAATKKLFQSKIKKNFNDVQYLIKGPVDLKNQELHLSQFCEKHYGSKYECLVEGTIEIPLENLTEKEIKRFHDNIKQFEEYRDQNGKAIFTVDDGLQNKILIQVNNAPIHSIDPTRIIELYNCVAKNLKRDDVESNMGLKSLSGSPVSLSANSSRSEIGENFSLEKFLSKNPDINPTATPDGSPRRTASLSSSGGSFHTL